MNRDEEPRLMKRTKKVNQPINIFLSNLKYVNEL